MPRKYKRTTEGKYDRKKICQYTMSGELVREWETATEIYNELKFDKSAILRCCTGTQKKSYWYVWKFKEEDTQLEEILDNKSKTNKNQIKEKVSN